MFSNRHREAVLGILIRVLLSICIVLIIFCSENAFPQQQSDTIRVGIFQNRPFNFVDERNAAHGIFPDIVNEIAKREEWNIEFVLDSWAGCLRKLENNDIDLMISVGYSKERDMIFDFSKEVVITAWGQIFTASESKINSILDLNNKIVAIMARDINAEHFLSLCDAFDVESKLIKADDLEDVGKLIDARSVDAGVINNINGPLLQRSYDIRETTIVFSPIKSYFAVPEGKNQYLLNIIDTHLSEWKKDKNSVYYEILDRWYGEIEKKPVIPYRLIAAIIIIAGCVSLFFFLWVRILRIQVRSRTRDVLENESRFRKLFESRMMGILFWSSNSGIVDANDTFLHMVGYTRDEILFRSRRDLTAPEYREQDDRIMQELSDTGVINPIEKEYIRKDGSRIPVLMGAAALTGSKNMER